MILLDDIENNREKFLELRKTHIGASDVPTILGLNKWKTPLELWAEKRGAVKDDDNDNMWYGREAENLIAKLYTRRNVTAVVQKANAIHRHNSIEWLTASPDFFIHAPRAPIELLECKTQKYFSDEWSEDSAPDYAHCQLITQMAVTELTSGVCGVIIAGDVAKSYFPRFQWSQELWDQMFPALEHFYKCMMDGTPPDIRAGDVKILNELYPAKKEEELDLSGSSKVGDLLLDYKHALADYDRAKDAAKLQEDRVDQLSAEIRLCLGEHKRGKFEGDTMEVKTITRNNRAKEASVTTYEQFKIKLGGLNGEK